MLYFVLSRIFSNARNVKPGCALLRKIVQDNHITQSNIVDFKSILHLFLANAYPKRTILSWLSGKQYTTITDVQTKSTKFKGTL